MLTKPEFRMLVGLPGSGKSYYSKEFIEKNPEYIYLSSDAFRKEHNLKDTDNSFWEKGGLAAFSIFIQVEAVSACGVMEKPCYALFFTRLPSYRALQTAERHAAFSWRHFCSIFFIF